MEEGIAVFIDQHGIEGTDLFRDQGAINLRRVSGPCRVILNRAGIQERDAGPIGHDQSVRRRSIMIRRRKALIVETPGTAGSEDNAFRPNDMIFLRIEVIEDGTGSLAVSVKHQFDSRRIFDDIDAGVTDFIAKNAHDFRSRIIPAGVHPFIGSTAAVGRYHGPITVLVE